MKKTIMTVIASFAAVTLCACTSKAGPFVTNISSDGSGGIVVEKCMVSLQRQINTMENSDCTNSSIKLSGK